MNHTLQSRQRGITLIETLIALVVTAIGLFGILGLQMHTLADTQGSVRRAQAIHLIEDLAERLQSNPDALGNLAAFTEEPNSAPGCASGPCAPVDLASYSVKQWRDSVAQSLPGGQAQVFIPEGGSRQLGVLIGWRESKYSGGGEPDSAEKEKLAKPFEIKAAAAADGADVQCPAGLMCHLQYLQPVQRCTPQTLGGGALYCPN